MISATTSRFLDSTTAIATALAAFVLGCFGTTKIAIATALAVFVRNFPHSQG